MTHDPLCLVLDDEGFSVAYFGPAGGSDHITCVSCHLIAKVRADQDKKHINHNCMWGEAECIPDCPSCRRFDELYMERSVGYWEGYNNALNPNKECTHRNNPDIWKDGVPYCRKCGQDTSYLYEMGN